MSFDFEGAIKYGLKSMKDTAVRAIVLAPSGGGKSSLCGTFPGKTLFIYGSGEEHGAQAANTYGEGDIDAVCIDQGRDADEAYEFLLAILSDTEFLKNKGYKNIAIDSMTELEYVIRQTSEYDTRCLTKKGVHDSFQETPVVSAMFRRVMDTLRNAQKELDLNYICTCILDVKVKGDNGEILESAPRLTTYAIAEALIQQFHDVFVVGRMVGEVEGETVAKHKIQFLSSIMRESKDQYGVIKKSLNFNPRLTGVKRLPNILPADLKEVVKLKKGGKK